MKEYTYKATKQHQISYTVLEKDSDQDKALLFVSNHSSHDASEKENFEKIQSLISNINF